MKKLIALVLSLAMLACLFAGCSKPADADNGDTTKSADKASFTIGFPWDTASTDPTWVSIYESVKVAVEGAGGELITVQTDLTADTLINNITELISRDVDGILFMPASDSMLPTVDALCAEAGVYWATMFRTISDDDIREQVYASKWFAGGCNEDDEACASNIVQKMAEMGVKNLCAINIAKGDTSSDLRDKGAAMGVEAAGINLLNTTYGITVTTDMTKTINSYIAAYPEMDGILLLGTPIQDEGPTIIITPYLELTSAEEAAEYTEYFLGDTPIYTKDEVNSLMIKKTNPDVSVDYINELLKGFSVADVVARHSK